MNHLTDYEKLLELVRTRRSIRRFAARSISRTDLGRILEAARWAPSNHNRQPWRFLVMEKPDQIRRLAAEVRQAMELRLKALPAIASPYAGELVDHATLFERAPVVMAALHKPPISAAAPLLDRLPNAALASGEPLSVAMAVQNLLLAAHSLGLGTCVMTAPLLVPDAIASVLPLAPGFQLTCLIALGFPAEQPEPPRRKELELIAHYV